MNRDDEARRIYLDAYKAFEQGDFATAQKLADGCLKVSWGSSAGWRTAVRRWRKWSR